MLTIFNYETIIEKSKRNKEFLATQFNEKIIHKKGLDESRPLVFFLWR